MWLLLFLALFCTPRVIAQSNDTAPLWQQALGGVVIGAPSAQAGSVIAALDSGTVKAYSLSGELLWSISMRGRLCPYVKRSREGITFICNTNGSLMAINRIGRELWSANVGGALSGPIVTGWDGRVFIPTTKNIFCYTACGTLLWTGELSGKISFGPILDQNGSILLALENGEVIRINPFGAVKSWKLPSVPVILVSIGKDILALYRGGNILRIDSSMEHAAYVFFPGLSARPLAAAGRDDRAAVFLENGQVSLLSGIDGRILWSTDSHMRPHDERAEIIFDERGIYALSTGGAASFTDNGDLLWFTNLVNASGVPAFGDDGLLYSGSKDWILNAWKMEERTLNQTLYEMEPLYGTGNPPPSVFVRVIGRFSEASVRGELETIQRGISAGNVGENELAWFAYLMETAIGGYWTGASNSREPRALINHRILALQLMSRIGSTETIPWLVSFFRRETEPLVRIAAIQAIGGIGMDPQGKAIQEFMAVVRIGNNAKDEQLLLAIASATGALCRFSGPPFYDAGSQLLDLLNSPGFPPSVRRQAQNELDSLQ